MYELVISADASDIEWLGKIERDVCRRGCAVSACMTERGRAYLCIGAEKRASVKVKKLVARAIGEVLLTEVKSAFIRRRVRLLRMCGSSAELLVHALTRFDRETEEDMLRGCLTVGRRLDIEGFRRFRMREFYARWEEMCDLARAHGEYLEDEKTFDDLLRFLVDSGKKRGTRAEVYRFGGKYRLVETLPGAERSERIYDAFDDLLCGMIDLAPCETVLSGFGYDSDYRKISSIFDVQCNILH